MDNQINNETSFHQPTKKSSLPKILSGIAVIAIIVFAVFYFRGNSYVDTVKSGYLESYPSMSIGPAFDSFFSNPKWKYDREDGDDSVLFTGSCWYESIYVDISIRFVFSDKETFHIQSAKMNGITLNWYEISGLIEAIYY